MSKTTRFASNEWHGKSYRCTLHRSNTARSISIPVLYLLAARLILAPGTACFARQRLSKDSDGGRFDDHDHGKSIPVVCTKRHSKRSETVMDGTGTDQMKWFCMVGFAFPHASRCLKMPHVFIDRTSLDVSSDVDLPRIHWPRPRIKCVKWSEA